MITYEERLNRDGRWALLEGSMYFEEKSAVHTSLQKIIKRLNELGISYAVVGGLALFLHGFRRFTDDVDLLVTRQSLEEIHTRLEGLGYLPPFAGSKQLRDTETGVKIEFLVTGEYPGDGQPKPIAFPDPASTSVEIDGVHILSLPNLIELKLASGMTNIKRGQDLIDVQRLIETLGLSEDLTNQLHPFVQEKYKQIWQIAHSDLPS